MLVALTALGTIVLVVATVLFVRFMRKDIDRARPNPSQRAWLKKQRRLGLLPPSFEPLGKLLWLVAIGGIGGACVCIFVWPDAAAGVQIPGSLALIWSIFRDMDWMNSHPEYRALATPRVSTSVG